MKTYFRLLSFAKPIEKFAITYILFTILYVIFSTLVLTLLGPLLNTLFNTDACVAAQVAAHSVKPSNVLDLTGWFNYYLLYFKVHYGSWTELKFVCAVIIVSVFVSNVFRYLSARTMENLRVHTLLNLRKSVFDNV